ncbi:metalloregulator ArsR/SmtB family transcription factor [Guyparkeria hydrothermalis]|uniref:metalloregulator ArsR/SmtB family transcription factor n=1 Tax=Guyparkeria hydrothermalis TaxID=923 RepID=UPI0032E52243
MNREANIQPEALFRALGDSTRLRSLMLLLREGELCVCELTMSLDLSQPKISRHLAHLREAGIAEVRRDGTWVFYRVNERLPDWAREVLRCTLAGTEELETFQVDRARLADLDERPSRDRA